MDQLLETLRIENIESDVIVYDLEEHCSRLNQSALELDFKLESDLQNFYLFVLNQIKNKAQYYFSKSVQFSKTKLYCENSNIETLRIQNLSAHPELYRLRLIYSRSGKLEINMEPYTRDLDKTWRVKILSSKDFHINSKDKQWQYKLYPRADLKRFFTNDVDEIIWLNENHHLCEGSFTNIIFQNPSGKWCSPCLATNILPGIMRKKIIENFNVEEGFYQEQEIKSLMLCNSFFIKKAILVQD